MCLEAGLRLSAFGIASLTTRGGMWLLGGHKYSSHVATLSRYRVVGIALCPEVMTQFGASCGQRIQEPSLYGHCGSRHTVR